MNTQRASRYLSTLWPPRWPRSIVIRATLIAAAVAMLSGLILPLQTQAVPSNVIRCNLPDDWAIPGGWFFRQGARAEYREVCLGYSVVDDAQAAMWTEFYRHGGVKVMGYPISRRYIGPGGYIQQGFEFAVLQWRPEENRGVPALIFEQFHAASRLPDIDFDSDLRFYGIPEPVSPPPGGYADEAAIRQSWLTNPQIMARYLTDPRTGQPWAIQEQAWDFYGLPQSPPERMSYLDEAYSPLLAPFVTQRFQRFALRLLLRDDPDIPQNQAGCVATVRAGALARLFQLIPPGAALEEPQDGPTVVVEVEPEQYAVDPEVDGAEEPILVFVRVSAINYNPNEVVNFVAEPREKPEDRAPLPWERDIIFSGVTNDAGEVTVRLQLWTVAYFVYGVGATSGAADVERAEIEQSALDEFPVAMCQALTSTPNILSVPTPYVTQPTPGPTPFRGDVDAQPEPTTAPPADGTDPDDPNNP